MRNMTQKTRQTANMNERECRIFHFIIIIIIIVIILPSALRLILNASLKPSTQVFGEWKGTNREDCNDTN